jgi:hypothetical protein
MGLSRVVYFKDSMCKNSLVSDDRKKSMTLRAAADPLMTDDTQQNPRRADLLMTDDT